MPYITRKMPNRRCYRVYNKNTKRVASKCTTMKRAKRQIALLNNLEKLNQTRRRRRNV